MEVQFTPEMEAKFDKLAKQIERTQSKFIEDALAVYPSELMPVRQMLDRRYDEVTSGKVKPIRQKKYFVCCAKRAKPSVHSIMRKLEFHPEARLDFEEIWEYIAGDNPDNADRVAAEIETAITKAFAFPQIGHPRPDLTSRPLLSLQRYDYLITYAADLDRLW